MMCLVCGQYRWDVLSVVLCVDQGTPNDLLWYICSHHCVVCHSLTFVANKPQGMSWLPTNNSNTLGQIKTRLQRNEMTPH